MYSFVFEAIGTRWQIDIKTPLLGIKKESIEKQIKKRIEEFDKNYSRFRADSLVRKMAVKKGTYKLPADAEPLLTLYQELYKLTDGSFTPLIGQVLVDAGYDEEYSLKPGKLSIPSAWEEVMSLQLPPPCRSHGLHFVSACHLPGVSVLIIKKPCLLDFGAGGKGYLVDIVGEILEENGVKTYTVEAGGDIRNRGGTVTLRVGLENPENTAQVIGIAYLGDKSICGSAGNRRRWANYHHIIDPFTLTSVQTILATWVISDTTMVADAISTCLFFVAPDILLKRYYFEYVILYSDFSIKKSEGFAGELFLKN